MAKRGGRLHQPTAAEIAASEKRKKDAQKKRKGAPCGCKAGWIHHAKGRRTRCPSCNTQATENQPTRRKRKNRSSGVGETDRRWGS